jgi:hypothetical protein
MDMRIATVRATREYLLFKSFEQTGQPLANVTVTLEAYDKAASRFFHVLFTEPSASPEASSFAHQLVEWNSADSTKLFDALTRLLKNFHVGCNLSLKQLHHPFLTGSGDDAAWRMWVWTLAKQAGLIAAGRPSSDKQISFVRFVWAIQECLPATCRLHADSEAAFAKAINDTHVIAHKLRL